MHVHTYSGTYVCTYVCSCPRHFVVAVAPLVIPASASFAMTVATLAIAASASSQVGGKKEETGTGGRWPQTSSQEAACEQFTYVRRQ